MRKINSPLSIFELFIRKAVIFLFFIYKGSISPYITSQCSYSITCSDYAKNSIEEKGVFLGIISSTIRVIKCSLLPLKTFFDYKAYFFPLNKKKKGNIFIVLILMFAFISCTNFSHQGGWSNVILDSENQSLYVSSNEGKLYNIITNEGVPSINWSYPKDSKGTSYSDPILYENSVISSSFDCKGKNCEGKIYELQKTDGELIWQKNIPSKISPKIQIYKDLLLVSSLKKQENNQDLTTSEIYLISLNDESKGAILGKIPVSGEIWSGAYLHNEMIFVTTLSGWLYVFDGNKMRDFSNNSFDDILIDSLQFPYAINSKLHFSSNNIYFSDVSGEFYSLNVSNIQENKSLNIKNWMLSTPLFYGDNLYVFTINGDVFLIDSKKHEIIKSFSTKKIIVGDPKKLEIDSDNYILIPTEKNGIEIINNDPFDFGTSLGRYPTDKKLYSSPLINDNNLIIHTQKSELLFFKLKNRDLYYCLDLNEEKICD